MGPVPLLELRSLISTLLHLQSFLDAVHGIQSYVNRKPLPSQQSFYTQGCVSDLRNCIQYYKRQKHFPSLITYMLQECAHLCVDQGADCPAFSIDYNGQRCFVLDRNTQVSFVRGRSGRGRSDPGSFKQGTYIYERSELKTNAVKTCSENKIYLQYTVYEGDDLLLDKRMTWLLT